MHSSFFEGGERHTYRHQALGMGIRGPKWVYWENPWINSSFFVGYLCFKTNLNIQDFGHFWAALHMPLVDSPAAPIPIVSGRSGSPIVGVFLVSRINRPHYNGFPYIGCCSSLWTVVWPSPAKMDESSRTFWLWMVIDPLHPHEYPIRYFHEYPIRITMRSHDIRWTSWKIHDLLTCGDFASWIPQGGRTPWNWHCSGRSHWGWSSARSHEVTWRFLEISRGPGDVRRFQEIKCWRFLVNGDVFLDSNGDPFLMVILIFFLGGNSGKWMGKILRGF